MSGRLATWAAVLEGVTHLLPLVSEEATLLTV